MTSYMIGRGGLGDICPCFDIQFLLNYLDHVRACKRKNDAMDISSLPNGNIDTFLLCIYCYFVFVFLYILML